MKVGFISLGCSKNLVDSENIMGMFRGVHELVNDPKEAEAIVINTCGFIESAKTEAINTILEMAEYKKANLKKLIVVGCLAQRYKDELEAEIPEVDAFVSIKEYPHLHEILEYHLGEPLKVYNKNERLLSSKPYTAYMKIAEGCSNCCTFCAIPLIRGGNVSYPKDDLVAQAKTLAKSGVKELVLIAQDTTKYGLDLYGKLSLLDLLEELNTIDGLHWIRILYMYPDEIEDSLIDGMKQLDKVIPYFDIPMQHANNELLKEMNRRGTKEAVMNTVAKIRETWKHPTLRTTFIVGFPGESDSDFEELCQFVKDARWDRMGAFTYSPEEDTKAYDMDNQIDDTVAQTRLDQLMRLQKDIALENNRAFIGEKVEVLVESQEGLTGKYRGRSKMNAPDEVDGMVIFTSDEVLSFGSFVTVEVTDALPYDLIGKHVK
ncbi:MULTISPECIES: 30S ribosomal protein S12 methylthiotransferase RimO [unclassified Breznakia]|uniref:30S ribosomal protein S12 methylthiotransferase RimO n=1 Tax=unclassified Breznakia TaxID=2623764 RepID=UPI002473A557|nr:MULTISPECIES: 30S ribosomal protein S12 methylthiotransferase RimO [unclassified Breznakia]MDH6367751.1 ribosomal protein S12 methylthiotransferase [Breznakia sp. PH1-1]MDH6404839.1 ribosomal protein S12 methylthiotransferase [Breznakia sp. PF1-11]MDH6412535.1 ribosomal protein S12 methylthiotransferase [Breznakia sp. PFB1-11]MDH6414914.1 ribosomal protein S12 methylthiotransferase [Breznakia sp. PFB1-14]MDH6417206.1 ribosomal protein S12 methylthiotransferase [Breznakia sp. PFB1-4]